MIELPEAITIARQINDTIHGNRIASVIAAHTPHKFAWYYGDPQKYRDLLTGKIIDKANAYGGMVEIKADNCIILLGDGVGIRFHDKNEQRPQKHQLLIEFENSSAISASIQMYGGLWCFNEGEFDNQYYRIAKEKPSPLSDRFNQAYFTRMLSAPDVQKLSVKAFLATEQRIPGLGNGVLQDILFDAGIHPKKKLNTFSDIDRETLYGSIKSILTEMTIHGGRDTEKDLYGCLGGYKTILSKNTVGKPCPVCGTTIRKENYMGGSIYYCDRCQRI